MNMYLSNISGASLLVWPQAKGTTLSVQETSPGNASSESGSEIPSDVADDALAQPSLHLVPDPQRLFIPAGWVYLGPGQEVLVKSKVAGGTGVTLSTDYYATVKWTLAQAADAWAASKLKSALGITSSPRTSALNCASDLQVTNAQVNSHPDPGQLVHDTMLSADDCASLLRAFAPDELPSKSAQEVESFSEQFAEKLPPDVWDGLIHGVIQLLHDR